MATDVYLEAGSTRTFAGALDWPGWCRSGRDAASALQALLAYGERYGAAIRSAKLGFPPARDLSDLVVLERLKGDSTTDFGAPGRVPEADLAPVDQAQLRRLQALLKACWRTFDRAAAAADGKSLRTGPRGGGRDLQKILEHELGAEQAYVSRLGVKLALPRPGHSADELDDYRTAILQAVAASAHGDLPSQGPRGGQHWTARYFVRRTAWHVLDHAWELEDRLEKT